MSMFDNSRMVDALCYDLLLSEFPRGQNRARIQNLANGAPPYSNTEVEENGVAVNINDLAHTRLMHDARSQFNNAFLKTGFFARAKIDCGPQHKRELWGSTVSLHWNKRMKRSIRYFEAMRAKFGLLVLHGIAPAVWENEDCWCVKPLGVEDVLIPGETLLGFDNLPFFVLRRSFTGIELMKLTQAEKRDPGWNMDFVRRILTWMEEQATQLRALNWPDVWAPEKIAERTKEEAGGTLAGDRAPRIEVFDIYAYDETGDEAGWVRRMILDSWSEPAIPAPDPKDFTRKEGVSGDTNSFLYTSGNRKVAQTWQNIISFQFADLSATFPARYHSVRSLGWMTYASCHLGMRLRCKFYESVLEALMQLYEVESQNDAQNALKLNLINKGFIDRTIRPLKAQDRWQVNAGLVELGLRDNAQVISQQSASWKQQSDYSGDRTEKTKFQVMAELQAMTALVSTALNQAYQYQAFEYEEIFRRFCKPQSKDPDVRAFRAACLKEDVPETYLNDPSVWTITSERIMGVGNKTLEMAIAEQLMTWRPMFDPEPQRDILRRGVLSITDDASLAASLVPEEPVKVTRSVREAEHIAATLLNGVEVEPLTGENHMEIVATLLRILDQRVQAALGGGSMMEPKELGGCMEIAKQIGDRIQIIASDKEQKQIVQMFGDMLGNLNNELKGFAQRLAAQQKKSAQGGNGRAGLDPKDAAKIEAMKIQAQVKAQNARESHAQRTAQRKIQFEEKLRQDEQKHRSEMTRDAMSAGAEMERNRLNSLNEE